MALGAILGLVGSVSTKVFGIFEKREERKMMELRLQHEVRRWDHETAMFTLQSQARVAETEQEAFLLATEGSFDGLKESMRNQSLASRGASTWVKNFITMFRPGLTLIFVGIVAYVSIFDNPDDYRAAAITASIELAMLAVTWWFGDRSAKRIVEMRGSHIRGAGGEF